MVVNSPKRILLTVAAVSFFVLAVVLVAGAWSLTAIEEIILFIIGALVLLIILMILSWVKREQVLREALQQSKQLEQTLSTYQTLIDSIPEFVWIKDHNCRFTMVNRRFEEIFGVPREQFFGKTDFDFSPRHQADKYYKDDLQVLSSGQSVVTEESIAAANGHIAWSETTKSPVFDANGTVIGTVGVARDITKRKETEKEINYRVNHDELTGVLNRRSFLAKLDSRIESTLHRQQSLGIFVLDIDRFKHVNDIYGHEVGDDILRSVVRELQHRLPIGALLARLGGDEFVVAVDVDDYEKAEETAQNIVDWVESQLVLNDMQLDASVSVGFTRVPVLAQTSAEVMQQLDLSILHCKQGQMQVLCFDPQMQLDLNQKATLRRDFGRALMEDELEMHYQPQYHLKTGALIGLEALVRWQHPERGLLFPGSFLPVVENSALSPMMTKRILAIVARQQSRWIQQGEPEVTVSVNLSWQDIQAFDVRAEIHRLCRRYGLPISAIEVEITERVFLDANESGRLLIDELNSLGVPIALDDFGTGYSNFRMLSDLPLTKLKIDRSVLAEATSKDKYRRVLANMIDLGNQLKLKVIAEGIETEEDLAILRELNCMGGQGYYLCRPKPVKELGPLASLRFPIEP